MERFYPVSSRPVDELDDELLTLVESLRDEYGPDAEREAVRAFADVCGLVCDAYQALYAACLADPYGVVRMAYDDYASVTASPLDFTTWLAGLARAAERPTSCLNSRPDCCAQRPHLRVLR